MALESWFPIPKGSHFSLANLPMGIISHSHGSSPRPAFALGDYALDLEIFTAENGFKDLSVVQPHSSVFSEVTLNAFASLGRPMHAIVRKYIQSVFLENTPYPEVLKDNVAFQRTCLIPLRNVKLHIPMHIGDYTDFFVGLNHARNCGVIFRGPEKALEPNYKHLPVAYHGRASSVLVSGTSIRRPRGQIALQDPNTGEKKPVYDKCNMLDFELELAAFVCKPSSLGKPIPVNEAHEHIFGLVLMNDWSARDVQSWEYVPLGPFNAKNFGTSISPWIVLTDALEPFRATGLENDVEILPYLKENEKKHVYDIRLSVDLTGGPGTRSTICKTNSKNLLFSFSQMLAHHTSTGCPLNTGDLIGSGTISGTAPDSFGTLLEQTSAGKNNIKLQNGHARTFLQDGDTVTFSGVCGDNDKSLVGFGECTGTIIPAYAD